MGAGIYIPDVHFFRTGYNAILAEYGGPLSLQSSWNANAVFANPRPCRIQS